MYLFVQFQLFCKKRLDILELELGRKVRLIRKTEGRGSDAFSKKNCGKSWGLAEARGPTTILTERSTTILLARSYPLQKNFKTILSDVPIHHSAKQ